MTTTEHPPSVNPAAKKISIKIFGVGGPGVNVMERMIASGFPEVSFAALHSDAAALDACAAAEKFLMPSRALRKLAAPASPETLNAVAGEELARLKAACAGVDVMCLVTGLGGRAGTLLSPWLAQIAKEAGALVLAFVSLPLECEGSGRALLARRGLDWLRAAADGVICLPGHRLMKLIDANTSLLDTFKISDDLLAGAVRGIWRLLHYTALIEIHLADLCALLRDRHAESGFAVAEAAGPDRVGDVIEKLFAHPLLEGGQALAAADTVLVSLMAGPDVTTRDVDAIMQQINRACGKAHVLMGAAVDAEFTGRLAVTLIVTRVPAVAAPEADAESACSSAGGTRMRSPITETELAGSFLSPAATPRPATRCLPPAPDLSPHKIEQLYAAQPGKSFRSRKSGPKFRQGQLPLEVVSKGRFEKSEPTIHKGEDLDLPTYLRRGMVLN